MTESEVVDNHFLNFSNNWPQNLLIIEGKQNFSNQ